MIESPECDLPDELDRPADYDADCPSCLRGRPHSERQHERILLRVWECSSDDDRVLQGLGEPNASER